MNNRKRRTGVGDFSPICVEVVEDALFTLEERTVTLTIQLSDEDGVFAEDAFTAPWSEAGVFAVDLRDDLAFRERTRIRRHSH